MSSLSLPSYYTSDNIAINCGFSGNYTALDGRHWIGDSRSMYFISRGANKKSISLAPVKQSYSSHSHHNDVPYTYARFSQSPFTYIFPVSPGPKFVRLHFYPASYRANFQRNNGFFTVKAGPFTLLHNFSASLTADSLGITTVSKEFCINVKANKPLRITFSPSRTSHTDKVYAFINGIEVVSMPNGLYYYKGENNGFTTLSRRTALETLYRLNIGGSSISFANDTGMFREWSDDSRFFLHSRVLPLKTTIPIKYKRIPNFVAPQNVYQTSWSLDLNKNANENPNFAWRLPVDQGFRYLIRFHFCELDYEIKEIGQRAFRIYINNHMVEPDGDVIKWSGEIGAATYKDYNYVIEGERMAGKTNILLSICSFSSHYDDSTFETIDVILKGLEIFKLSNPDNNLAAPNPLVSSSLAIKGCKSLYMSAGGNKIATIIVIILTMLNVVFHKLCALFHTKDFLERTNILSKYKEKSVKVHETFMGPFSFSKVWYATNNFDVMIGKGAFGNVYKGCIKGIDVAMKRLDPLSEQGTNQFLNEIEILGNLQNTNIIKLIGYCNDIWERILVYEYMARGTLADHLYNFKNDSALTLSWEERLKICIGVAKGLEFLHNHKDGYIIHRDIKSTNILIDENWVAKVADFGLSKMVGAGQSQTHISTEVRGSPGYLNNQYWFTKQLTKNSDVFAFGVVLWEVLCGRAAIDTKFKGSKEEVLAKWAPQCFNEGNEKINEIIDRRLMGQISPACLKIFTEVANSCLFDNEQSPSMTDVVTQLELAYKQQVDEGTNPTSVVDS
ncbi:receptor-like protein kinase FERONIA [Impatiens glandulifera]|uniref:receptor-like protein kinase FERONIA n=1 Tax=Impatiens glandulifera TaxID=253017 RepID=UPI001FB17E8C|nr:receptor-like protein kinase FERONIA [Impatiens glandulifera]